MTTTMEELKIEVISGTVLNRVRVDKGHKESVDLKVMMPKAITDGINLDTLEDITVAVDSIANRKIKTTHVQDIILKLTTPYDSVFITEEDQGFVVPSYFAILRYFDPRVINPRYVAFILNSTYGKEQLTAMTTGTPTAMLKIKDVLSFPVPMLPIEKQKLLGDLYIAHCGKRASMKKYIDKEEILINSILKDAIGKEV